ncbi:MAG TPA: hypothetical protein VFV58_18690 [Blastocatellia bacterium]|jgi:hypothetical protein|nr:hypothetical protein [Blastocatellia bacterium]
MARITLLILSALLVGCAVGRPAIPEAVSHSSIVYKTTDLEMHRCLFEQSVTGRACLRPANRIGGGAIEPPAPVKDDEMAVYWRDTMINSIRRDIESYYHEYETQLADGRRRFGSAIEVAALAGVAATTISKGERARTVIATMVSFLQGGRGKIDQGIFRDRTTDVIIQKMRASRARVETRILRKMAELDATHYGFSEAERDLRELFWAGTLQGGFLELSLSAGNDAAEAVEERNSAEAAARSLLPIATPRDRALAKKIDVKITELARVWRDNQNTPTGAGALQTLLDALKTLKTRNKLKFSGTLPADTGDAKLLIDLIRSEMEDALNSGGLQEKLPVIAEALGVK